MPPATTDPSDSDYRALAELRHQLRRFVAFSEAQARAAAIEPRQHQLLLALRGLPEGEAPTIRALADRLVVRHHTAVELVDRLETGGLVRRARAVQDRRQARVSITARGRDVLRRLSVAHKDELFRTGPALVSALQGVLRGV